MDIGIGIIGTGGIARAHAEAYLDLAPEVELVAVCDIDAARAKDAAAEWGVAEVCTDYRDLLSLDEIDAGSVCTPTAAHCEKSSSLCAEAERLMAELGEHNVRHRWSDVATDGTPPQGARCRASGGGATAPHRRPTEWWVVSKNVLSADILAIFSPPCFQNGRETWMCPK